MRFQGDRRDVKIYEYLSHFILQFHDYRHKVLALTNKDIDASEQR